MHDDFKELKVAQQARESRILREAKAHKLFQCEICQKKFSHHKELTQHQMLTRHNMCSPDDWYETNQQEEKCFSSDEMQCPECNYIVQGGTSFLISHLGNVHGFEEGVSVLPNDSDSDSEPAAVTDTLPNLQQEVRHCFSCQYVITNGSISCSRCETVIDYTDYISGSDSDICGF